MKSKSPAATRLVQALCCKGRVIEVDIWVYCLMPNHVHLIAVPDSQEGLSDEDAALLRGYERTGLPLVSAGFVECLEKLLNCVLNYKSAVAQGKLFIRTESKVYCITSEE